MSLFISRIIGKFPSSPEHSDAFALIKASGRPCVSSRLAVVVVVVVVVVR
jgi:hypothetical protein